MRINYGKTAYYNIKFYQKFQKIFIQKPKSDFLWIHKNIQTKKIEFHPRKPSTTNPKIFRKNSNIFFENKVTLDLFGQVSLRRASKAFSSEENNFFWSYKLLTNGFITKPDHLQQN